LMHVTYCAIVNTFETLNDRPESATKPASAKSRWGTARLGGIKNELRLLPPDLNSYYNRLPGPPAGPWDGPRSQCLLLKARARPFPSGAQGRRARAVPRLPVKL
jgi:hypothetical protein